MKKMFLAVAAAVFAMATSASASADIIYSENADGLTAGTDALNDSLNSGGVDSDWNGTAGQYGVVAGGSLFATNHFELTGTAGNFSFGNWEPAAPHAEVQTFSIDLADTGGGGTNADAGVRIAARRTGSSTFFDVVSQSLTNNTISTFHVVANNSASAATYEDGVTTIAAGTADFWQDGSLVQSKSLSGTGDVFSWGLWARRADNQLFGDNIEVRNTAFNGTVAAVPEPTSIALLGLGALGLIARRRR